MTDYDVRPDFMRDIADLKRQSGAAILDYTPIAHAVEPDGNVQFPDGINVGGEGGGPNLLIGVTPPEPGALTVVVGANANVVYADVSWPVPDGFGSDQVVEYEVELALITEMPYTTIYESAYGDEANSRKTKQQETLISIDRVSDRTIRLEPLEPVTQYIVRVRSVNNVGFASSFAAEKTFTTGKDTTIPVQVTGLTVGAGLRSITAFWADNPDPDVRDGNGAYEMQVALDAAFTSGMRSAQSSGSIASVTDLSPNTTYHVRVRAIDASGNEGPWSASFTVTTAVAVSEDLANGAITETKIGPDAVTTPKILAGSITTGKLAAFAVDATKIAAGTIVADSAIIADGAITNAKIGDAQITSAKILDLTASKITTGTLSSTIITTGSGGVIRTGTSNDGVDITASGITLRQGGSIKAQLPNSGSAYFEGSIYASSITASTVTGGTVRTGTSGRYVRMTDGSQDRIQWINNGNVAQQIVGTDFGLSISGGELALANNGLNFAEAAGLRSGNNGTRNEVQSRSISAGIVSTTTYLDMAAVTFRTTSLAKYKRNISEPPAGALDRVRQIAAQVAMFNMVGDATDAPAQLGVIADNLPATTRMGDGYSVNAMLAELSVALVELADRGA